MARGRSAPAPQVEQNETVQGTETVTVTETDVETVPTTVINPEGDVAPAKEPVEDLSPVLQAAESAVAAKSEDADKDLDATATAEAYQKLTRKGKTRALAAFATNAKTALMSEPADMQSAIAWTTLQDAVKAKPKTPKAPGQAKAPADPTESFVRRLAVIQAAYAQITETKPEGVKDDWNDKLRTRVSELKAELTKVRDVKEGEEAPELSADAQAALKLSSKGVKSAKSGSTKSGQPYTGDRRSLTKHIAEAFENVEVGTFLKVSDIAKHKSSEYGEDSPSQGAVSASLKSTKFSVQGVRPANGGPKNQYGAVKV